MYSSHVKLQLDEKLNLFERELVKYYKEKLEKKEQYVEFLKHEMENYDHTFVIQKNREHDLEEEIR